MPDHILNYVRCPYCGGNAAVNHECDDEARQQAANEAFARFMDAVHVEPADANADQLRVKLAECEEALHALEDTVREQDAEIERLRFHADDEVTALGNDVLQFAPQAFDDDVAQEEIVVRYVRWLEQMAVNSRGDIVFTANECDDALLAELHDALVVADVLDVDAS